MSLFAPSRARRPSAARAVPPGIRSDGRHGAGFWLIAFAFLTAMAFSTVPTPLYPLYQARDGFSVFMVTVVFAGYAVGVLTSLLLAGRVSDQVGRKNVLFAALTLELVAAAVFIVEPPLPALIAARVISGLGIGLVTATATAYLQELHRIHRPGATPQRFEVVSTAANIGGLGVGPLVSGLLAQYLGAPLRVPYIVFGALLVIGIAAVALTPETVGARHMKPLPRPQRISIDRADPTGYISACAAGFAAFAVFGLFTSVAPGFISGTLHQPSRALAGLVVFSVFGAAALAQTLTGRLNARLRTYVGPVAQAVGVIVLAISMHIADLGTFVVAGIVVGAGAGVVFKSSVAAVAATASPAKRSEALAGLFLFSYLGLAVPAIGVGIAARYTTETNVMTWFAGILLVLLAGISALTARHGRTAGASRETNADHSAR
ncbi:MFS family permease [Streptacidiphilus sp. MAP12-20]|uniref:MFS transporter n=1 Tax=Streptacidiphilus sp. MAP12-20 TaxID=3156299 RepID=UPI003514CB97